MTSRQYTVFTFDEYLILIVVKKNIKPVDCSHRKWCSLGLGHICLVIYKKKRNKKSAEPDPCLYISTLPYMTDVSVDVPELTDGIGKNW